MTQFREALGETCIRVLESEWDPTIDHDTIISEMARKYPVCDNAEELLEVAMLAVDSQTWDGNDPDEDRWRMFYRMARAAISSAQPKGRQNV